MTKDTPIIRSLRVQSNRTPSGATQLLDDIEDKLPDDISLDGDDISDPNYEPNIAFDYRGYLEFHQQY